MKIVVDTNVIIDILCKREPFFEDSYNALNKCIDNHTLIVSASAITDIYFMNYKRLCLMHNIIYWHQEILR